MKLYSIFLEHPDICTDSRNCPKNSIFFALKGGNFDANAFALSALEKGCSFAVIDDPQYAIDERFIVVDDVLTSLQNLANHHRKQLGIKIIGITGTNGKTTSKELIYNVLKHKFNTHYTKGNLNNHIGVPLTLLQLKKEHEIGVIEMGANHPGEIAFLCKIAEPDFGIITNVGKAHLEGFGSFEGVKRTKSELYNFIYKHGEKIFMNNDNLHLIKMAKLSGFKNNERIISYNTSELKGDISVSGKIISCSPFLKINCINKNNEKIEISTSLIGAYNTENVLAAVTIGMYFGLSLPQIKIGLENYVPTNNRSQLTVTDRNKIIVDAYNSNPTSLHAAINNFAQMDVSCKTLIIGDMLELGDQSENEHKTIIDLLNKFNFKRIILVGKEFSQIKSNFESYENVDEVYSLLNTKQIYDSYILLKGSRGIKLEKLLPLL